MEFGGLRQSIFRGDLFEKNQEILDNTCFITRMINNHGGHSDWESFFESIIKLPKRFNEFENAKLIKRNKTKEVFLINNNFEFFFYFF